MSARYMRERRWAATETEENRSREIKGKYQHDSCFMNGYNLSLRCWDEVLPMITPSLWGNKRDLADLVFIPNIMSRKCD